MSDFQWLPILEKLNGRSAMWGVFGFVVPGVWIESYGGEIFAFTDPSSSFSFQTRHRISIKDAGEIYRSGREVYQLSLF